MNNSFQYVPGKAAIQDVTHTTGTHSTNITDLVKEINVHTSVNIKSIIVEFSVLDTLSYISKAPIQPGDVISFTISYADEEIERRVKVMEVNSIISLNERNLSYKIKASSDLRFNSTHIKISKSFHGLPSEIAYVILKEHGQTTNGVWEKSKDNYSFIAPNWDPITCIKFLAKQSVSIEFPEHMMFFQDSRMNYHFACLPYLNKLYASENDMITYTYGLNTQAIDSPSGNIPNTESTATAILGIRYHTSFDFEDAIKRGTIQNTVYNFDTTTGSMFVQTNNRWDTYSKNNLNSADLYQPENLGQGKITVDYSSSLSRITADNEDLSVNRVYEYDRSQEIEIEVLGNHITNLGQVINLEIISREAANGGNAGLDERWSGLYSITAKRDVHRKDNHTMILRCAKNSINTGVV